MITLMMNKRGNTHMKRATIGLDLGGTNIKWAVFDAAGGRVFRTGQAPTRTGGGAGRVAGQLADLAGQTAALASKNGFRITALGIGAPGLVENGIVRDSPNLPGWGRRVPLLNMVKGRLPKMNLPLLVENDVNCMLTAECRLGAGRGYSQVVGLAIGTGVGGGIWVDGRLLTGAHGGAGELGHMTIMIDGPRCKCGNSGCLEALIGSEAIISRYRRQRKPAKSDSLTVAQISARAKAREPEAVRTLTETGLILGAALASLANIFNPQAFVIGGGVSQAGRLILGPAETEMRRRAMPYNLKGLKIKTARLGPSAGAVGAAILSDRMAGS
jgi:glucokinase